MKSAGFIKRGLKMHPAIAALLSAGIKIVAHRVTKENIKDKTTIAAGASAAGVIVASEFMPADTPETLIIQAVLSVLAVVLFFYPPKKIQS